MRFNKEVLRPAQNQLGLLAAGFAQTFNAQNSVGTDLNGAVGGNIFTDFTDPVNMDGAWHAGVNNRGTAKLDVSFDGSPDNDYKKLLASDYDLVFSDGTYVLTRNSDKTTYTNADGHFNIDGLSIQIHQNNGEPVSPEDGDRYVITPFHRLASDLRVVASGGEKIAAASGGRVGISDNTNALALAHLQVSTVMIGGRQTFQDAYGGMVTWVGEKTRGASINYEAHQNIFKQMNEQQQSISGVNLDEEASNLLQYQQAYQAAAKIIPIANNMFDALLSAIR